MVRRVRATALTVVVLTAGWFVAPSHGEELVAQADLLIQGMRGTCFEAGTMGTLSPRVTVIMPLAGPGDW